MESEDLAQIKGKIVNGVFALTTRSFILQVVSFVATFILTILLSPSIFGVFFVVSAVISFLSYFSDIGLAAALVQKKENPDRGELVTVFTIQQILVVSIVIIAFFISPILKSVYGLNEEGLFLLQALLLSFFLSSLKTIPSILLERKLEFKLLVVPQLLETSVFYLIAIILAYFGSGISSFAWAAVVRGFVGLIAIYYIQPWKIGLGIDRVAAGRLLSFGIPFQTNSVLALVKDDLMILFLGAVLPLYQIGYIGWAKKWAEAPLRLIMDNIIRVTFPAYARLQHDTAVLGKAIEKSFFFLALFIFPITFLLVIFVQPLTQLIPKYSKWEPAVFSFYFFAFSSLLASFSSPLVNALNAIGKIKTTLVLMIIWTVMTWILIPIFIYLFGYHGVAIAAFVISFTGIIPIIMVKKIVHFPVLKALYKPVIATFIAALPMVMIVHVNMSLPFLALTLIATISVYGLIVWFWMKKEILPFLPRFLKLK